MNHAVLWLRTPQEDKCRDYDEDEPNPAHRVEDFRRGAMGLEEAVEGVSEHCGFVLRDDSEEVVREGIS